MTQKRFEREFVYDFTDDEIVKNICSRLRAVRRSCCLSQREMAEAAGIGVATVKRIESGRVNDISLVTLLRLMRAGGVLEGVVTLIEDVPESPFLENGKGRIRKNCSGKFKIMEGTV